MIFWADLVQPQKLTLLIPMNSKNLTCIIGKPLQYMIASCCFSAMDHKNINLIVMDSFLGASQTVNNILKLNRFNKVFFCRGRLSSFFLASFFARSNDLLIDSDVGFRIYFYLLFYKVFNLRANIWVYEEGVGTYIYDLEKYTWRGTKLGKIKKNIANIIGVASQFGNSVFTSGIYLYNRDYIVNNKKNKVFEIKLTLMNYINSNIDELERLFALEGYLTLPYHSKAVIYLSNHEISPSIDRTLCEFSNYLKLCKPHPHLKRDVNLVCFDFFLEGGVPVELYLARAIEIYDEIVVLHHGSSTKDYYFNKKIKYIYLPF